MYYDIKKEEDRIPTCEMYIRDIIKNLDYQIAQCDYCEDVVGELVYTPGAYREEKQEFINQKVQWETLLNMLTGIVPCSYYGN